MRNGAWQPLACTRLPECNFPIITLPNFSASVKDHLLTQPSQACAGQEARPFARNHFQQAEKTHSFFPFRHVQRSQEASPGAYRWLRAARVRRLPPRHAATPPPLGPQRLLGARTHKLPYTNSQSFTVTHGGPPTPPPQAHDHGSSTSSNHPPPVFSAVTSSPTTTPSPTAAHVPRCPHNRSLLSPQRDAESSLYCPTRAPRDVQPHHPTASKPIPLPRGGQQTCRTGRHQPGDPRPPLWGSQMKTGVGEKKRKTWVDRVGDQEERQREMRAMDTLGRKEPPETL